MSVDIGVGVSVGVVAAVGVLVTVLVSVGVSVAVPDAVGVADGVSVEVLAGVGDPVSTADRKYAFADCPPNPDPIGFWFMPQPLTENASGSAT